jgi:hypothetical protein
MKEKQEEFVKSSRSNEVSSAKDLDAAHQRRELDRQEGKAKSRRSVANV